MPVALPPPPAPPGAITLAPGRPVRLAGGRVTLWARVRCRVPGAVELASPDVRQAGSAIASGLAIRPFRCAGRWRAVRLTATERPRSEGARPLVPGSAIVRLVMFRGEARRESTLRVSLVGPPVAPAPLGAGRRWRLVPDGDYAYVAGDGAGLVVTSGRRYDAPSIARDAARGVDPATGAERWRTPLPGAPTEPAVSGGTAVVATANGWVVALDAGTGERRWARRIGVPVARPVIDGDTVVAASQDLDDVAGEAVPDGTVRALDLATGDVRWRVRLPARSAYAAAADGVVYLAPGLNASGPRLQARDTRTGALRWSVAVREVGSAPAIAAGTVFLDAIHLEARDADTGALRWRSSSRGSDPVAGDGLVLASQGYDFTAFDAATGAVRWRHSFGDNRVLPVVLAGRVLVGFGGLWSLSAADGAFAGGVRAPAFGRPVVAGDIVAVGGDSVFGLVPPG